MDGPLRLSMRSFQQFLFCALVLASAVLPYASASDVRRDQTVAAVERVMPSVVNISSKTVVRRQGFFFDWWRDNWSPFYQDLPPQYSAGSGVIIDEEGYVLTNVHVVEDASEIVVKLADGRSYPAELVVGTRKSDVALLRIRAKEGERFTPIQFAADDDLLLGETVVALGNPFGLGGSVSRGILSSKTRRTTAQEGVLDMEDWIQTDAAINPGNSGGPLVNLDGNLIGLNVAIFKEGQGIGFAIPVKRITESLAEIYRPEILKGLWFGAQFRTTTNGVQVAAIEMGSPAEKSGLKDGDVVLRLNGTVPRNAFAASRLVMTSRTQELQLQVRRNGRTRAVAVRLLPEGEYFTAALIRQKIGITISPLAARDAARIGLAGGFIVTEIERNSPADHAGFQKGLIVESIERRVPDSIVAAARLVAAKKAGESLHLTVIVPGRLRRAEVELVVR